MTLAATVSYLMTNWRLLRKCQQLSATRKSRITKKMSWVAVGSMVGFTAGLFTPFVPVDRVAALADLLGLFYLGQASIVGFYFGAQAYMSRQR